MAEAAISFALETLSNLLIQKVDSLRGVEGEVEWVKRELQRMQTFLKDAAEKQANNDNIRQWISEIRGLAQDAEDVIDTFILEIDNPRRRRGLLERCACFPSHLYHLGKLGNEIKSIKARLEEIEISRQRYKIENIQGSSRRSYTAQRRRLSPWQRDKHMVGVDEDVKSLLREVVLEERKGLSVASIVGMGGIGKSTLARAVYNHNDVADRFERRAWVVVSEQFNHTETIKELVLHVLEPNEDKVKVLELIEKSPAGHLNSIIYERLKGKRYFIVVDDVWRQQDWELLTSAFPDEEDVASRLIVTSRIHNISRSARYVYEMKTLDPDKSWELLLKTALNDNNDINKCPQELEYIGREIVAKCNGLPLAITVMGGLLQEKSQTKSGWEEVLKGINSHLGTGESNNVQEILELSYHDLPSHLKSCFLCLAFFKEDATIHANTLIKVWIAQGLVPQEDGQVTMEDVARGYLDELINRNMVQVRDMQKIDQVKNCGVHDLLHELSIRKAKEEMSLEILKHQGNISQSLDRKSRHCAIYSRRFNISSLGSANKHLRSLFFRGGGYHFYSDAPDLNSFRLLRILEMEGLGLTEFPPKIGALTGLRYVNLKNNEISKLPKSLGCLKNLQVLDMGGNGVVYVPNVIWKMDSLRHINIDWPASEVPLKLNTLRNLQTLTNIEMYTVILEHIAQITSLRKLGVRLTAGSDVSTLCTSLAMLENLVCLKLYYRGNYESTPSMDVLFHLKSLSSLKLQGLMPKFTSVNNFPPNLSSLTLKETRLQEDSMRVLEKLPNLVYLKLDMDAYIGHELVISHEGFPSLKVLYLRSINTLINIKVEKGGMPKLKRLEIRKCINLVNISKEFCNLQELKIVLIAWKTSHFRFHNSRIMSKIPFVQIVVIEKDWPNAE